MKRSKVVRQRRGATSRSPLKPTQLNSSALDRARTGEFPHTVLTMEEAAEYIGGFTGERRADSCRKLLQNPGVHLLHVGREFRVRQSEIDRWLETGKGSLDVIAEKAVAMIHNRAQLHSAAGRSR